MFGDVFKRLFLFELLAGTFFLKRLSLTKLTGPPFAEVCDCGFPVLLATDCDLLLGESTLLPLPLPTEWRRFDIYLILAFFLD
jgi:hypothetical protein